VALKHELHFVSQMNSQTDVSAIFFDKLTFWSDIGSVDSVEAEFFAS
jgi:hypothetical protein